MTEGDQKKLQRNLTPAEQMIYSSVKITAFANGQKIMYGSGFYFGFTVGRKIHHSIVTNRHVLEGADRIDICLHQYRDGVPDKCLWLTINFTGKGIVGHPDKNVDLCTILVGAALESSIASNFRPFFVTLTSKDIPDGDGWDNFDAIEEVHMVGCPNGLNDEVNNFPLVRRGITATSLSRRYNGRNEFMIDLACFQGSSGSPVFVYNRDGYWDKQANTYHFGQVRLNLVGILYAGPQVTTSGNIVLNRGPSIHVQNMMHLGYVIRADEIRVLENAVAEHIKMQGK